MTNDQTTKLEARIKVLESKVHRMERELEFGLHGIGFNAAERGAWMRLSKADREFRL